MMKRNTNTSCSILSLLHLSVYIPTRWQKQGKTWNVSFQHRWLEQFPWLLYSTMLAGGLCRHCILFPKPPVRGSTLGVGSRSGILVLSPYQKPYSNALGKDGGVQAKIKEISPLAIYTHCYSHCLNLSVAASCKVQEVRNLISLINESYLFFCFQWQCNGVLVWCSNRKI